MLGIFRNSHRNTRPQAAGLEIAPGVKVSVCKDGVIFLHTLRGSVFSANSVGASIWEGVCAGRTIEDISSGISREYQAPLDVVGRDAAAFVDALLSEGILQGAAR